MATEGVLASACCGGIALYLTQSSADRQGIPDCAGQIVAMVSGMGRQVLGGSPSSTLSAAHSVDPPVELRTQREAPEGLSPAPSTMKTVRLPRKAKEQNEKCTAEVVAAAKAAMASGDSAAAFGAEVIGRLDGVAIAQADIDTSPALESPGCDVASAQLIEEMKQQLLLKESLEGALRQKLEYMDLQLRQKEQEKQYFKAQLDVRDEVKEQEVPGLSELVEELKKAEEALSLERSNAVAQAKALAEANVQLKQLQERPSEDAMVRAHQDELVQLHGQIRCLEEERNAARMGLANQAAQLTVLNDRQTELEANLNAAHQEIKRQKELLEEAEAARRELPVALKPQGLEESTKSSSGTSKLSHSELQVLRSHMQSAVRRALQGAGAEQGPEYQQKLQELDDKLVELSPTRLRRRPSSETSGNLIREVEQKLTQLGPRELPEMEVQACGSHGSDASMEDSTTPEVVHGTRPPLRRPSNMSGEVVLPQGISSAGELGTIRGSMIQANFPTSGSVSIPAKTQAAIDIRPVLSGSRRLATPSSWGGSSAPVMLPRSMEVLPAAQMAANAMAATAWRPTWGPNPKAFQQSLPREISG